MNKAAFLLILSITYILACSPVESNSSSPTNPILSIEGGQVQGVTLSEGVYAYRGIPFAAPPIGELMEMRL